MFNRKLSKKLSESVRREQQHQADIDHSMFGYRQRKDQQRQETEEAYRNQTVNSLDESSSNTKQRSKSRIAAGFNPDTGQAYLNRTQSSNEGSNNQFISDLNNRPRSRQSSEDNRKAQSLSGSDYLQQREKFLLPTSTEEIQEEFDVDQETGLQYPTQAYLTGENLLEEYSEELNVSSANNIRTSQQSQQKLSAPSSPQVSRHPFSSSSKQQQFSRNSQIYEPPTVSPLIPNSGSYNTSLLQPMPLSRSFDFEQSSSSPNPEQQQVFQNSAPFAKSKSKRIDYRQTKRSQTGPQNSSVMNKRIDSTSTEEQQQLEQDAEEYADEAESQLSDDVNLYNRSVSNVNSKGSNSMPPQQQQQPAPNLGRRASTSNSNRNSRNSSSRRPSMVRPDQVDQDQDVDYQEREYRNRDPPNSKLSRNRDRGEDVRYTSSVVSRPNSSYSLTNPVYSLQLQQGSNLASRDVIPLPIEIPDSVTDADAFRRYLSTQRIAVDSLGTLGRNSVVGSRTGLQQYGSEQGDLGGSMNGLRACGDKRSRQDNFQQQQQQQPFQQPGPYVCPPVCQNPDNGQAKFQKRTASLSHAIMTLALLSASAAQLRFVVAYSHAHAYPTLNYFLICSCLIIEVLVGIGFVILARFDFSEAFQDKLHSYLIFGLFVVTVANVIVAAFALDDHICEVLMKRSLPPVDPQFQLDNSQLQLNGLGP